MPIQEPNTFGQRLPTAAAAALLALATAGCAANWLFQSPSEADLPLEAPAHGYPTAVRAGSSSAFAAITNYSTSAPAASLAVPSGEPPSAAAQAAGTPGPTTDSAIPLAKAGDRRVDSPAPGATPLAVLPPQYRSQPSARPAANEPAQQAGSSQAGTDGGSKQAKSGDHVAAAQAAGAGRGSEVVLTASTASSEAAHGPVRAAASNGPSTGADSAPLENSSSTGEKAAGSPAQRLARIEQARRDLVAALEAEISGRRSENAADEELPRLEQELRLAYLACGKLDEAVSAVESLDLAQAEAYKHLMFGLGVWLSPDEARRVPLRAGKVLQSLRQATMHLSGASKLTIPKLALCERVDYFGWYTEFPRYEFQPRQEVILYAEVENYSAEYKPPSGYETELHGRYEILDASGHIVAERQLPVDKEICRNYRRDYFLAYKIYMPDSIGPGRYRLELTIEDLKAGSKYQGRKFGQGTIEFTIR